MDFDSDDLEDYDGSGHEEFHEDDLDDQEYDQLYEELPKLKKVLQDYNDEIPEYDLKEALYYVHYDVDAANKDLRTRFKKKGMYHSQFSVCLHWLLLLTEEPVLIY